MPSFSSLPARAVIRIAGGLALALCACQSPRPTGAALAAQDTGQEFGTPPTEWKWRRADPEPETRRFPLAWSPGEVLLQGTIGALYLSDFSVDASGSPPVELDDDEIEILPAIGGGAQWKLAGNRIDFGLEGLLAMSGRTDLEAFVSTGGSTVAAFDVSLLVLEAYGGPFVSTFLGRTLRVYGGGGPLLQWASYEQDDDLDDSEDADGSGGGVYARAGFEFLLPSGKLVGFGARWTDSSIDLGGDFGDLDMSGLEVFVTYSYGLLPQSRYPW
jgi:hypothetical protein